MAEFLLELYSEEVPPKLQINARNELKQILEKLIEEEGLKYKSLQVYSTPTRLTLFIQDLSEKVKILSKEIKGPKVGVPENTLESFIKSQKANKNDVFEKEIEKGKFYFIKTKAKEILTKDLLARAIQKSLNEINWKK